MADVVRGTLVDYYENGGHVLAMVVANADDWSEPVFGFNGSADQPIDGTVLLALFDSQNTFVTSVPEYSGEGDPDGTYQLLS